MENILLGPHGSWDSSLASRIDHTILRADAMPSDIEKLCAEALAYRFASVCINPWLVSTARVLLADSSVAVCSVVGFPLGAHSSDVKLFEAKKAVFDGATELDLVINVGALKAGNHKYVVEELQVIRQATPKILLKLILETCLLTREEIVLACQLASDAGFDFVKTSTGFANFGATAEHVALMRASISPEMQVKASGGIRDRSKALELLAAGASRIGSSLSIQLVRLDSASETSV